MRDSGYANFFARSGECFIAAPDLKSIEIPADLNVIAKYPIAPLVKSENANLAAKFTEYVLSAEGQAVLQKWGFAPIK